MLDPSHPIVELLKEDDRYSFDAYVFVFEALNYAQNVMQMGNDVTPEMSDPDFNAADFENDPDNEIEEETVEHHVTGQQLCEAIREYALRQYGYMAKDVLGNWGITGTNDFGEIVFNLISIEQMRKTPHDRKEDFFDVYDFDTAFRKGFKITPPEDEV